jgi:hypothetical protein
VRTYPPPKKKTLVAGLSWSEADLGKILRPYLKNKVKAKRTSKCETLSSNLSTVRKEKTSNNKC